MHAVELRLAKTATPLRFVWTWPDIDVARLDLRGGQVDDAAQDRIRRESRRVFFLDGYAVLDQHDGGVAGRDGWGIIEFK